MAPRANTIGILRRRPRSDVDATIVIVEHRTRRDRSPNMPSTLFGLREPLIETHMADSCLTERHERLFLYKTAVVPRIAIRHHWARISHRFQITRNDVRKRCTVWTRDVDRTVQRRCKRGLRENRRDIFRSDRLKQSIAQAHRAIVRAEVRDTAN